MNNPYAAAESFALYLMENSAPGKPAWNKEMTMGHIPPGWNYIDGCMVKAILDLHNATGDEKYLRFADEYIDFLIGSDGAIKEYRQEDYNSDNINEGKVLFPLYDWTKKEKYRLAIGRLHDQLSAQPRTASGNFWHKMIYPHQVWLDGLYMTLPFFAEYERRFNNSENVGDILRQFRNVRENMRDADSGLFYHGRDEERQSAWADPQTGCSANFWSRSLGWYCMALVDTAEQIDEQIFYERELLIGYLKEILDAIREYADPQTGMLWQVTDCGDRPGNYLETSGTCAVAYALMKGARLGFLPEYYYDYGLRMFDAVYRHKFKETADGQEFELTDICLVAGLGVYPGRGDYKERDGSFEYYISEPRVSNDAKGVAPFLMAYAEVLRKMNATGIDESQP